MIVAIIQARSTSSRLPGKVMKPILGEPMLARQIERVARARRIDRIVVATSVDESDDALAALCGRLGVACHRGSLDDVLARFHGAAETAGADTVVRLTGDCPLSDPAVIDAVVAHFLSSGADYASNVHPPTFPDGLDVEVMRFAALDAANASATLRSQREHVTPYIYGHPEAFTLSNLAHTSDLSHLRWTVDNPQDFELVSRIYGALYPAKPDFAMADVLALLERQPQLSAINADLKRNEGLAKSLADEA